MELELILGVIALLVGGLAGWFLKSRRNSVDVTQPFRKPPDIGPLADEFRDAIRDRADAARAEVEDVTSDPTPPTDGEGLATIADARRRNRHRED